MTKPCFFLIAAMLLFHTGTAIASGDYAGGGISKEKRSRLKALANARIERSIERGLLGRMLPKISNPDWSDPVWRTTIRREKGGGFIARTVINNIVDELPFDREIRSNVLEVWQRISGGRHPTAQWNGTPRVLWLSDTPWIR